MAEENVGTPETPAAPVASSPTPAPSPSPTPAPSPAPTGEDQERRFKGIQADLAKERKQRQEYEQQAKRYQAQYEAEQKRVQALAGLSPKSESEAETEAVRARFAELFPHLAKLTPEAIQRFEEAQEDRQRLQDMERHYWGKHGNAMIADVTKELTATFGGELNKRQVETITRAYVLRAQQDPEFLQRHEAGDESLVKEFAKEWVEDWFEPARRQVTKTQVGQFRPVPSGQGRNIVNQGEKKIDVTNNDQVMDFISAGRQFTGRNR